MHTTPRLGMRQVLRLSLLLCAAASALGASDTAIHLPLLYDSFLPPAAGQSYADQAFGTSIKRLSDAVNTPNHATNGNLLWIGTEYPTASPFNMNNSRLILQHQGYLGLYDGSGTYLKDLPFAVNVSTEPRWSRTDPNALYYVTGNRLMKLDVPSGRSTLVHAFTEYAGIRGRGESDISRDGDHFVFAGDEPGGLANRYVFVYEITTNTKGAVLDTVGHPFGQLYLAPDNSVAIGWIAGGAARFTGIELFDRNLNFLRQLTHAIGHMHLTRDVNDDVLVWTNSDDAQPIANCQNGIVKVRLRDAHQTCLLQLDWSLAVHITAGDGDGWVFVETYDPADPPASTPAWRLYTNEILQVKLDGSQIRRLLHHRSRQTANYEYQPRATVSRDGSTLVYSSTYGLQSSSGHAFGYTDVYFAAVPLSPLPHLSIDDASVVEGDSGTSSLVFTVSLSHVSDLPVTVSFQSQDGTAIAPTDYIATGPQTLTFPPMTATRTISIPILGDTVIEPTETFFVDLSLATNAVIDVGRAVGTIRNDDYAPIGDPATVYRLLHPSIGAYLFTIYPFERDSAQFQYGYLYEGPCCKWFTGAAGDGRMPLYRLFSGGAGEYLFTITATERDAAVSQYGYVYEGVAAHCHPVSSPGAPNPWYRLRSGNKHLYTIYPSERDAAVSQYGYVYEGITCYLPPP